MGVCCSSRWLPFCACVAYVYVWEELQDWPFVCGVRWVRDGAGGDFVKCTACRWVQVGLGLEPAPYNKRMLLWNLVHVFCTACVRCR